MPPIANLKQILQAVVEVSEGRLPKREASEQVAEASQPAGEYLAAIGPPVQAWLQGP